MTPTRNFSLIQVNISTDKEPRRVGSDGSAWVGLDTSPRDRSDKPMKINDSNLNGVNPGGLGGSQGADRTRATEGIQPGSGSGNSRRTEAPSDQVQLSNLSRSLNASDVSSPERLSQVDQLRFDVGTGRYQPDPLQVSKAVVQSAIQGLG
jgi:hypothetical protein